MEGILVARVGLPSWFIVTSGEEDVNSNDPNLASARWCSARDTSLDNRAVFLAATNWPFLCCHDGEAFR
jgi:hypothetical protein